MFGHFGLLLVILICLLLIGVFVFEILMFVDVIKNKKLSNTEKVLWAGGMVLIHPIVAIFYYFIAHSRLNT